MSFRHDIRWPPVEEGSLSGAASDGAPGRCDQPVNQLGTPSAQVRQPLAVSLGKGRDVRRIRYSQQVGHLPRPRSSDSPQSDKAEQIGLAAVSNPPVHLIYSLNKGTVRALVEGSQILVFSKDPPSGIQQPLGKLDPSAQVTGLDAPLLFYALDARLFGP